jgi:rod shape-determining protein MreC
VQVLATEAADGVERWFQADASPAMLDELEQLRVERNLLIVKSAELQTSLDEARQGSSQASFLESRSFQFQTARVIARSLDPNARTVTIDQGASRGIREGQAVVVENGILVGLVIDTTQSTSEVMLITDRRSRIASVTQNEQGSPGITQGELGLSLRLELVPQNESLAVDTLVVTSGLESEIPRGLVIGKITEVHHSQVELFQSAALSSPAQLERIQVLSVILQ